MPTLDTADSQRFLRFAHSLADTARDILQDLRVEKMEVSLKADGSYVSVADTRIEAAWREAIRKEFPDHGLIGEEYPAWAADSPWQWVLDPIDGTDNFVHGIATFGSLISLRHEDFPVLGIVDHPLLDVRFSAAQGLGARRNGQTLRIEDGQDAAPPIVAVTAPENFANGQRMDVFCALAARFPNIRIYRDCFAHSCVLQGSAAAMVDWHVRLWDVAAAEAIVKEAGGAYVRLGGSPDRYQVVFGRPSTVSAITAMVNNQKGVA